jgi:hypothetical protein
MQLTFKIALLSSLTVFETCCLAQDVKHCIPLDQSRLLHEYAVRYHHSIPLIDSLEARAVTLQQENVSIRTSYSELLRVEKEKNRELSGKSGDLEKIISLQADQIKHEKKRTRAVKWQRNGLGILLAVVIGLTITH